MKSFAPRSVLLSVSVAAFLLVSASNAQFEDSAGVRVAMKLYEDCNSGVDGLSVCLKKKAITFIDRLGRMDQVNFGEAFKLSRSADAPLSPKEPVLTEEQLETSLPRAVDAKDEALTSILMDRATKFISSRSLQVTLPKFSASEFIEEGRRKSGGGLKGMMGGMMMGVAAKMAALIPIAIAGLFLLAGKALITAKIALLLSGIIALKKLFAQKNGGGSGSSGGHGSGGGWQSSGSGGWQSSGSGWDKRSLSEDANKLAYNAYQ